MEMIWKSYSGEAAWQTVADLGRLHRIQASPGYREAAQRMLGWLAREDKIEIELEGRKIEVEADTTQGTLRDADELAGLLDVCVAMAARHLIMHLGSHPERCLDGVGLVVVSPGVPPAAPLLVAARTAQVKEIDQLCTARTFADPSEAGAIDQVAPVARKCCSLSRFSIR